MSWAIKLGLTIGGILIWYYTQRKIGERHSQASSENGIFDVVHKWTAPLHQRILANSGSARALLISSSLIVDILGFFLLYQAVFGATIRPLLGLFIVFGLRQINQAITILPAPKGMIWSNPGFPSVFVTYGVSHDLFFSGHTALAVYGALELAQWGPLATLAAGFIIFFEVATVLVLRAHWTMDVFAGAVTALWVFEIVSRWAPRLDLWLSAL